MTQEEFVAALVARVREKKLPSYAKQTAADVADILAKDPEVFISGELGKGKPTRGQSKVGGKPDVPEGFEWPCEEDSDEPLQFVAQINLAEVHPHDLGGRLPARGMVWLFSIADGDRAYGHEIDSSTTAVRYLAEPGPLSPHDIPDELADNEDATIKERKLEIGPTVSLDAFRDSGIKEVITAALREVGGRRGPLFMLNEAEANEEEGSSGGVMLADLDGYAIAKNAFGEGSLSFVLTEEDLSAGDLEKADTVFSTGT